jgi:gamma-glutamyltranspeptidase/glutathione hydrolase
MDGAGEAASLSLSNGEGNGWLIPGTGIMLNNMLGEEDINPRGFHRWPTDRRLSSMMAPSIVRLADGRLAALGSGGSNRLRTAILQVISNLVDFGMPVAAAVESPRIHHERDRLSVEGGFEEGELRQLLAEHPDHQLWPGINLFFGGVHSVLVDRGAGSFHGAGDPRRGGVSIAV